MFEAANPRHRALDSHSESGMWNRAVATQIEIPLKRFDREMVLAYPRQQFLVLVNALPAADDFAIPLGRQHIHAQGKIRASRIGLHIEGFERSRISMHDDGAVEFFR